MNDMQASIQDWIGRTDVLDDHFNPFSLAAMAATLEHAGPLSVVPPLWHWLYFLPSVPLSQVGPDGHPQRGGFLPPVPLTQRMWAGGRLTFHAPLHVDKTARRTSVIGKIEEKNGRSGKLVFVTVQHRIESDGSLCIEEEQDIVYRNPAPLAESTKTTAMAPTGEEWSRVVHPDPVLLFRYSALTFNSHRIHYDQPYVTHVEGYPGLVVHGPLIATLLAELMHSHWPHSTLQGFGYRAVHPVFVNNALTLCGLPSADGRTVALWATDHQGHLAMLATATLA